MYIDNIIYMYRKAVLSLLSYTHKYVHKNCSTKMWKTEILFHTYSQQYKIYIQLV